MLALCCLDGRGLQGWSTWSEAEHVTVAAVFGPFGPGNREWEQWHTFGYLLVSHLPKFFALVKIS